MTIDAFVKLMYEVCNKCLYVLKSHFLIFSFYSSEWCNHTLFSFHFQRDLIAVQEKQIHKFKDSLVMGVGEDPLGSSAELVTLCVDAVQRKKTSCQTQLHRYLAIANPANREDFFREV